MMIPDANYLALIKQCKELSIENEVLKSDKKDLQEQVKALQDFIDQCVTFRG